MRRKENKFIHGIRFSIDMPEDIHKKFKSYSVLQGKSMREIIINLVERELEKKN